VNSTEQSEAINTDQSQPRWFIDLDWYERNNRSYLLLAHRCMCPKCCEQLKTNKSEIPAVDLLSTIKDCCSKTPDFITDKLPILESIFRIFLSNGNQPLTIAELRGQLNERRGDTSRIPDDILSRLLKSDRYYGLSQVAESGD